MARNLLELPSPQEDDSVVNLADWLELSAVFSDDFNASKDDLKRALQRDASLGDLSAEAKADAVFNELSDRSSSCGSFGQRHLRYPFCLDSTGTLLCLNDEKVTNDNVAYLFMLLLTKTDLSSHSRQKFTKDPTKIFEELCCHVLGAFWGNQGQHSGAMLFGTAARGSGHTFKEKLSILSERIGEGGGPNSHFRSPRGGDGRLDVVAWKRFSDQRTGGLIGFAQCKTGTNWERGLRSLNPENFLRTYMRLPVALEPLRMYMVPNRISSHKWQEHTGDGGLLWDRCRIMHYSREIATPSRRDCRTWVQSVLNEQKRVLKGLRP